MSLLPRAGYVPLGSPAADGAGASARGGAGGAHPTCSVCRNAAVGTPLGAIPHVCFAPACRDAAMRWDARSPLVPTPSLVLHTPVASSAGISVKGVLAVAAAATIAPAAAASTPAHAATASASVVVVAAARKCGHCGVSGHDRRNCPSGGTPAERKCGVCGVEGHDRRACPSKPAAAPVPPPLPREHVGALSRVITGPARPLDPAAYWAGLGDDAGSYPFQRDARGALHLPRVCVGNGGSAAARAALALMPEYTWDPAAKVYVRNCPCPGCK